MIYRGKCSCGKEYIEKTERIVKKRWSEHNNASEKTDSAQNLLRNITYLLVGKILIPTRKDIGTPKD